MSRAAIALSPTLTLALTFSLSVGPAIVGAHGDGGSAGASAGTGSGDPTVPFAVTIGASAVLGIAAGLATVVRYRSGSSATSVHETLHGTRLEVTVLLLALGLVASLSALTQQWPLAVGGGVLGGTVAWFGRTRGISPRGGCADAAFGAILAHRTVEGALVASVYAASAALGLLGLTVLTAHAIAETIAVGGLYASVSRGWGVATVVAVQLGFVAGALLGGVLLGLLSTSTVTLLLAAVGGVLLVTSASEFRVVAARRVALG